MNDLELVQSYTKGDKRTWDEFVEKYSRLIYKYIHSVLQSKGINHFSQDDINDLFQDFFLCLVKDNFKKLRSFKAKNGCSLASWLRQVVINFTIDYIRKFKPVVSLDEETDDGLSLKDILTDGSSFISDILADKERLTHLKDCIERLDTDDKYFLELHINRDLGLEELRDILKLSRGAVDMRKSRIVERLRECFKSKGVFGLDS